MKKILKILLVTVLALVTVLVCFLGVETAREWKPKSVESVQINGKNSSKKPSNKKAIKILSLNIGYAAMGKDSSFVLDGGDMSYPSKDIEQRDFAGIKNMISENNANIYFIQEVDRDSTRSYKVDQADEIGALKPDDSFTFANDIKTGFTPFPIKPLKPLGFMNSGAEILNSYHVASASRIQLPIAYKWPVRLFNFKRALLVERVPVANGKDLVLINIHLDAFTNSSNREEQFSVLKEYALSEYKKGNFVVYGGDFNMSFPGATFGNEDAKWEAGKFNYKSFPEGWGVNYSSKVPTNRAANKPYIKGQSGLAGIDGFLTSPNISVKSFKVLDYDFQYTDHNPVVMKFKLKY